jgi:hypothetical protein
MILAHVQKTPTPPSAKSELEVPTSLDRTIMMCLAKEPAERPDDAEALARILKNEEETGFWTRESAQRWWLTNVPEDVVEATQISRR